MGERVLILFFIFLQNSTYIFFVARLPPAWVYYKLNFIKSRYKGVSKQKAGVCF